MVEIFVAYVELQQNHGNRWINERSVIKEKFNSESRVAFNNFVLMVFELHLSLSMLI